MKTEMSYLTVLLSTVAAVTLIGCQKKAAVEVAEEPSTSAPASLKPKYCLPSYGTLTSENGNYELRFPDLGEDPVLMSGAYQNGVLSLTGQFTADISLNVFAGTAGDGSYLAMSIVVLNQGQVHHMLKFLGTAGDCPTTDINQLPKLAVNPVNLNDIKKISRYRSSEGHNYGDASENGRSLKHYFEPISNAEQTVEIYAPMRAVVVGVYNDDGPVNDDGVSNQHITLQAVDNMAVQVEIFHTTLAEPLTIGQVVDAGQMLAWANFARNGYVASNFDFAIHVSTASGKRNVSIFDIMTDGAFAHYTTWSGASTRDDFKISKALRDANPLQVQPHPFIYSGHFVDQANDPLGNLCGVVSL